MHRWKKAKNVPFNWNISTFFVYKCIYTFETYILQDSVDDCVEFVEWAKKGVVSFYCCIRNTYSCDCKCAVYQRMSMWRTTTTTTATTTTMMKTMTPKTNVSVITSSTSNWFDACYVVTACRFTLISSSQQMNNPPVIWLIFWWAWCTRQWYLINTLYPHTHTLRCASVKALDKYDAYSKVS